MTLGIGSKNVVSRVLTKIKEKLGKVDIRKGANFLGPLRGFQCKNCKSKFHLPNTWDSQVRMVLKSKVG